MHEALFRGFDKEVAHTFNTCFTKSCALNKAALKKRIDLNAGDAKRMTHDSHPQTQAGKTATLLMFGTPTGFLLKAIQRRPILLFFKIKRNNI